MPSTYTLISSNVLSSSAASVTFSAIPSTYTDLVVRYSIRCDVAASVATILFKVNGATSGYSWTNVSGNGAAASSTAVSGSTQFSMAQGMPGATATSNTFANNELYLPNYASTTATKQMSHITAQENNNATAYVKAYAQLYNSTSTITSLSFENPDLLSAGSSFYLYGIKNS